GAAAGWRGREAGPRSAVVVAMAMVTAMPSCMLTSWLEPDEFHPAVLLPALGGVVRRRRLRLAESRRVQPVRRHAALGHQPRLHRRRAPLGEVLVEGVLALAVGVALDREPEVGMRREHRGDLLERG